MRRTVLVTFAAVALSCGGDAARDATPTEPAVVDDETLAAEAFLWAYPLLVSERTMQRLGSLLGVNTLFNQPALSDATTRFVVSPNQDTLYSIAVLDLRSEPQLLTVPDVTDRYWTYQFLDAFTNSFQYIGTRATGGRGGRFLIVPPGWKGTPPEGATVVVSPTNQAFLLGRYLVTGADDVPNVKALVRTLVPLHAVTGSPAPEPPPEIGYPPGQAIDVGVDGAATFDELGDALAINAPPYPSDVAAVARYARLGIGPGRHPSNEKSQDLAAGVAKGLATLHAAADDPTKRVNGWTTHLDAGNYPDAPLLRAVIAKLAWAANVPDEAVYPISLVDAAGQPYAGAQPRVLHFAPGALPPVDDTRGFWSLTLYGPDRYFVENKIQRFAIGDRTPGLAYNSDGSLDLFVQNEVPVGHEGNWLPAPAGAYSLMLRMYLPKAEVLKGGYAVPAVALR